tara:strand:- start:584 stop:1360 length:777 start_codon:yes stop_codon:yes gene_type:complete
MLTFLRKIRKSLIESGSTRKYLLYAIGEIALVVMGILIALQINNWNEDKMNRREEVLVLDGLEDEFEENLDRVEKSIAANEATVSAANRLIDIIRSGEPNAFSEEMDSLVMILSLYSSFDATMGVVDEVINSGKLKIIEDRKLRTQLTRWPSVYEESSEIRGDRSNIWSNLFVPTMMKSYSLANGENYIDFSTWSERYKVEKRRKSPFKTKLEEVDLRQLENVIWQHKYNNHFIIMIELEIETFIIETIGMIREQKIK